jgi:hypothetical protein
VRGFVYDGAFHIYRRAGSAWGIRRSHRLESAPEGATPEGTLDDGGGLGQIAFLHEAHRLRHAALHLVTHFHVLLCYHPFDICIPSTQMVAYTL